MTLLPLRRVFSPAAAAASPPRPPAQPRADPLSAPFPGGVAAGPDAERSAGISASPAGPPAPLEGTEMPPPAPRAQEQIQLQCHPQKQKKRKILRRKKKKIILLNPKARAPGAETSPNPRRGGSGNVSSSPLPPRRRTEAPRGSRQPRLSGPRLSPGAAALHPPAAGPSSLTGAGGPGRAPLPPFFFLVFGFFWGLVFFFFIFYNSLSWCPEKPFLSL